MVAFEPDGTDVDPIWVNGAEFPCMLYERVNWLSASVSNWLSQGEYVCTLMVLLAGEKVIMRSQPLPPFVRP